MWMFACRNLWSRPIRSLLALLGLTVAIMGMVGLFSIAAGLQATVSRSFNRIPGMAAMQPGTPIPLFSKLPAAWADEIAGLRGVRTVCREIWSRANLVEGQTTFNPPRFLFGCDLNNIFRLQTAVYRDDMVQGRFLQPSDAGQPVCVVSQQVADEYKKTLGDVLRVDGFRLKIIGIYETNSLLLDVAIVTSAAMARQMSQIEDSVMSSVYIEPDGSVPQTELADQIRTMFRGRGTAKSSMSELAQSLAANPLARLGMGLRAPSNDTDSPPAKGETSDDEGLEIRSAMEWGQRIREFSSDLDIFLVLMNSIGVMIALLSILNTMLMSVSERMTEFGVLRANGWSARNVMQLVLAESAILGLLGGVLGCGMGYLGTLIINDQFPTKLNLYASPGVLLLSLSFSVGLGMVGGLYPAWWSIRRSPMEAIRRA